MWYSATTPVEPVALIKFFSGNSATFSNAPTRARFLQEAIVTGGLEHPSIVPVYGLGHYDDGRPFYAMRFVHGNSLNESIKDFHRQPDAGRQIRERSVRANA